MQTIPGLVLLTLCAYSIYFYTFCSFGRIKSHQIATYLDSSDILPLGEYKALRAELGLLEISSHQLSSSILNHRPLSNTHSANQPNLRVDDTISKAALSHRVETSSVTDLRDESWHNVGLRKMRRRSATFGLGSDVNMYGSPVTTPLRTPSTLQDTPLRFAVDAVREPCASSERALQEYALLASREELAGSSGVGSTKASKRIGGATRSKSNSKKASSSITRVGSAKRARGGRRLVSRTEH